MKPNRAALAAFASFALLAFAAPQAHAQNWTTVTALNITTGGNLPGPLTSGLLCFKPSQSFQVGGGGQTITQMICTPIINGAIGAFQVPNPAAASPTITYEIMVLPRPQRPGTTPLLDYTMVTFSGATFDFDNYSPPGGTVLSPVNTVVGPFTVSGNTTTTGDIAIGGNLYAAPISYTVSTLPTPSATKTGEVAIVTDAATAGSCTVGSGSQLAWCRNSGSAWVSLGGSGGSGTVNSGSSGDLPSYPGTGTTVGDSGIAAANVAQKSASSDAACYVTKNGNDSNDGLSWGTARLTVYGCLTALPGGSATTLTAGQGTVYVGAGTALGTISPAPSANQQVGVLLLGSNDPHWSNTLSGCSRTSNVVTLTFAGAHNYFTSPTGQWIQVYGTTGGSTAFNGTFQITGGTTNTLTYAQTGANESCTASTGSVLPAGFLKESGGVNFVGKGSNGASNDPGANVVTVQGNGSPMGGPAFGTLDLAGVNSHYSSDGIYWEGCLGIVVGRDSNFGLSPSRASTFSFYMDHGGAGGISSTNAGCGPAAEWGSNVLWSQLRNSTIDSLGQQSYSIGSLTSVNNVVSAVLSSGPTGGGWQGGTAFQVGDQIIIYQYSTAAYDGTFTIASVTDATHFTYNASPLVTTCASACGSGGTAFLGPENNRRAGVNWDPTGGNSVLNYFEHLTINNGGGIRAVPGSGGTGDLFVDSVAEEGSGNPQPVYECGVSAGVCPQAQIRGVTFSDTGIIPPQVLISGNADSSRTTVYCLLPDEIYVQGPALTFGCNESQNPYNTATVSSPLVSPAAMGQSGIGLVGYNFQSKLYARDDNDARLGVPTLVRFQNLATSGCSSWTNVTGGNLTITTAVADMLGQTGACNLNVSTGNGEATSYNASRTIHSGDYFFAAVWAQSSSTAGWNYAFAGNCPVQVTFGSSVTRGLSYGSSGALSGGMKGCPSAQDDGRWQWVVAWDSVNSSSNSAQNVTLAHYVKTGFPANVAYPVLLQVPISSISQYSAALTSVSAAGGFALFVTTSTHAFVQNQIVCVSGVTDTSFNKCQQIVSVPASNEFLVAYSGASTSSTGGTAYASADSEAAEIALSLSTYLNTCSVGQMCNALGPVDGGAFSTQSSTYALKATDGWVNVTGTTTVNAPHAIVGQKWTVFNSGSGTVTLQADSGNINGGATVSLSANTGKEVTCDGTNCFAH